MTIIITAMFFSACGGEEAAELDDKVAEFQGEVIQAEDVLYQYSLSEDNIAEFLKESAVVAEAQALGIEVSDSQIADRRDELYPGLEEEDETDFFKQQAAELDVSLEEYFEDWADTFVERDLYLQLYAQEKFDNPQTEEELDAWSDKLETHIDELFADYKAEGEIVIY